jgi:hypothetical protein
VFKRKRSATREARSFRKGQGEAPHARRAAHPLKDNEKPDQMAERDKAAENHQEALLDEAIEESFPGSDPVSASHFT